MSQQGSSDLGALDEVFYGLVSAPNAFTRRFSLAAMTLRRQDRRGAALGHRHAALGLLMAAESLGEIVDAAVPSSASEGERLALASLWAVLYRVGEGGPDRGTPNWNPGTAHLRHARDVRRWAAGKPTSEIHALLRQARRRAAAAFLTTRDDCSGTRKSAVCPI